MSLCQKIKTDQLLNLPILDSFYLEKRKKAKKFSTSVEWRGVSYLIFSCLVSEKGWLHMAGLSSAQPFVAWWERRLSRKERSHYPVLHQVEREKYQKATVLLKAIKLVCMYLDLMHPFLARKKTTKANQHARILLQQTN
jgi:hypothetical protein